MNRLVILNPIFRLAFFLCTASSPVLGQTAAIDSLKKVIDRTKEDGEKALSLCRLCWHLKNKGLVEEALQKGEEGLALAQKSNEKSAIAGCFNNLCIFYAGRGEYGKAADHAQQSIKIYKELGDSNGVANSLNGLANAFCSQGNFAKAIELYLLRLRYAEALGKTEAAASCLLSLGNVFFLQRDYKKAVEYHGKSLKILESIGDSMRIADCLHNLANDHYFLNDYEISERFTLQSLNIYQILEIPYGVAYSLDNLANIYSDRKQYDKAAEHYLKALDIKEAINDLYSMAISWGNLSNVYLMMGRTVEARVLASKSLTLAQEVGDWEVRRNNALFLSRADSAAGDFRAAYEHYKLFSEFSDSLKNDEQTKRIATLESRYQFEIELAEKKRQEEIAATAAAERQERLYMFQSLAIFGFLMLMIFSLFLLGKLNLSPRVLKALMFVSLIMTFEFAVMIFDPLNDKYSQGLPIIKMIFNTSLALMLWPIHNLAERKLSARLLNNLPNRNPFKRPFDDRE